MVIDPRMVPSLESILFVFLSFAETPWVQEEWPIKQYDGNRIEEYYSRRPLAVLQRFLRIGPPITAWYAQQQLDKRTAQWLPKVRQTKTRRSQDKHASLCMLCGSAGA